MLKILIMTLLMVVTAWTDLWAWESQLSESDKASVKQALAEAAKSKQISQQQYTQALSWVDATPCEGVDRDLPKNGQTKLANAIEKQLRLKDVDVLQTFRGEGWSIVYVVVPEKI